jgi:periplasmic protein TonB
MRWIVLVAVPALFIGSMAGAQSVKADSEKTYFAFQVQSRARGDSTNEPPIYPHALRVRNIEGVVNVQFVVDTSGRADMTTFQVVRTYDTLFTQSVKTALAGYHFSPATLDGKKVRQLVMMPFYFRLNH